MKITWKLFLSNDHGIEVVHRGEGLAGSLLRNVVQADRRVHLKVGDLVFTPGKLKYIIILFINFTLKACLVAVGKLATKKLPEVNEQIYL